jgi:hypothetical protein
MQRLPVTILSGLILAMLVSSCSAPNQFSAGKGNKYKYYYRLIRPASDSLKYRDDSLLIQFRIDEAAIRFQLQNLTRSDLRIDWSKPAVGIGGQFVGVRHAENLYSDDTLATGLSHVVPPYGFVRELLLPRQNISFDGRRWEERDLLPTMDNNDPALRNQIIANAGKKISVVLPLVFAKAERTYRFDFAVDSVRQIAWRDYKPLKRIPAPPVAVRSVGGVEQITAAVLTVGVLGFSAYMLSAKKDPPTE